MELVIIAFLTLLNALFALSEVALISVKVSKLEHLVSKGSARARMALKLLKEPEGFLSSIQVGITLIGIVSGAYGGAALTDDVEKILESIHWLQPYTHEVSLFLVIGGLTYFSIAVGELVPKTIAMNNPEKIALWCAPVILYFSMFMYPFVKTLSLTTAFLLKVLRVKDKQEEKLSEEELRFLLKTAGKQGVLHKEESEVHENLFHFFDLTARGLMTPRNELEWIDRRLPKEEILERIRLSIHSKFPVCDKSLDDIVGFITVKDFLENYQQKDFILSSILREAIYFPMTMTSYNILAVFKQKKQYMGFVLNEYGSLTGMVTIHDLTEAIVGDLPFEEEEEQDIVRREDGSYLVDGQTTIHRLNKFMGEEFIAYQPSLYSTLAGFIISHTKTLPYTGLVIDHKNEVLEIMDMDERRIDKVLIKKKELKG